MIAEAAYFCGRTDGDIYSLFRDKRIALHVFPIQDRLACSTYHN